MRGLLLAVVVVLCSLPLSAAAIDCRDVTLTSMQDFLAQSAEGGCFVQDKLFTNFTFTGGGIDPADINVNVVFSPSATFDIHGFSVFPTTGLWLSDLTFGFTISVDPPLSGPTIIAAQSQGNFGVVPNDATGSTTLGNGVVLNMSQAAPTDDASFAGVESLTSSTSFTINGTTGFLISLEQTFTQRVPFEIPEPATSALMGLGLIVLAGFSRFVRRPGRQD
jgi:hypothetical protein